MKKLTEKFAKKKLKEEFIKNFEKFKERTPFAATETISTTTGLPIMKGYLTKQGKVVLKIEKWDV